MKCLGLLKADKDSEAGVPPSRELMERMGRFMGEITKAGVLVATDGLHPSAKGKRVRVENGRTNRHRRSLHRVEGARRLLRGPEREVDGRGRALDGAVSGGPRRGRVRDPADLRAR